MAAGSLSFTISATMVRRCGRFRRGSCESMALHPGIVIPVVDPPIKALHRLFKDSVLRFGPDSDVPEVHVYRGYVTYSGKISWFRFYCSHNKNLDGRLTKT
jgi:hypothetical protein